MALDFINAISDQSKIALPKIVVIGVGGAGCNAVNGMMEVIKDVVFVVANTDYQVLLKSNCPKKIQLGATLTNGLGAGSDPDIGAKAAEESSKDIEAVLDGANMVFITCGMGGGTGTGAAPVIARIARQKGILTVGVVTKPFSFEKDKRMRLAEEGVEKLNQAVDTLIVIPNQNLYRITNEKTTLNEAFGIVDGVLLAGVRCITSLITSPGLINLDFADVAAIMRQGGKALMGDGEASGQDRAIKAAESAIQNPLLECNSIKGATGLLINVSGGLDMTLLEVSTAIERVSKEIDTQAHMKFGSVIDPSLEDKIRVSVVATGVNMGSIKGSFNSLSANRSDTPKKTTPVIAKYSTPDNPPESRYTPKRAYSYPDDLGGSNPIDTQKRPLNKYPLTNNESHMTISSMKDETQTSYDINNIQNEVGIDKQHDILETISQKANVPAPDGQDNISPIRKRIILDDDHSSNVGYLHNSSQKEDEGDKGANILERFSGLFKKRK